MSDLIGAGGGGGGKGGGGGSRTPVEAKDRLESTSYAVVVDLLGEGEIEGFSTPSRAGLTQGTTAYSNAILKDIYFDNTPILNPSASNTSPSSSDYNFKNVQVAPRFGTRNQARLQFGDEIIQEIAVGLTIEKNTPITRTITDTNVDQVRLLITVPQLQEIKNNGDIVGSEVQFRIEVQYNGGGFNAVITDTITGRTSDQYQRDYRIDLRSQNPNSFPVDIRLRRLTDDSNSSKLANSISWTTYTQIIQGRFNYPHSALVGLRIDAQQFSSIPQRTYRVRGLKVAIPSNATVDNTNGRLTYSGTWNGTFGAAQWTTDPAWVLWNLLTNTRYGFGTHVDSTQLDKWAFYSASQYCRELVPDGFGGTEPRFSCNVNIQSAEEAYKLVNDLSSVMRAMPFWSTGALTISQDKPVDSAYLFTLANVTEEGFAYSGSDVKTRPNVVV
ncbi:MAG: host specificity protein J, partial [Betaproteobacteria bacterium]|nr:host specificity protein J [Betaproteobacteria bacterium]